MMDPNSFTGRREAQRLAETAPARKTGSAGARTSVNAVGHGSRRLQRGWAPLGILPHDLPAPKHTAGTRMVSAASVTPAIICFALALWNGRAYPQRTAIRADRK